MKLRNLLLSGIVSVSVLGVPSLSLASTGVRQMRVNESSVSEIRLAPGYGINISFIRTGEVIEKVWLDDPSWVVLDVDGCLAGLGESKCETSSARVLHLRRIEPLSIPGLPSATSAQLTVITRSASFERRLSVFRVVRASSPPDYHTVEVVPPGVPGRLVDVSALERGRQEAIRQNWLESGSLLDRRIVQFLSLLAAYRLEDARQKAGISLELVERLEQLGRGEDLGFSDGGKPSVELQGEQ